MARTRQATPTPTKKSRHSLNPESREKEMISLAVNLAEQQLRDGTASSQVITHYLKMGGIREKLERERLEEENKLLRAKTKAYENAERERLEEENKLLRAKTEALKESKEYKTIVEDALKAMQNYKGMGNPDEYED